MLKRKLTGNSNSGPHVPTFDDDPTLGRHRKRLFRPKHNKHQARTPNVVHDMSQLLGFVLQHEEAFQK